MQVESVLTLFVLVTIIRRIAVVRLVVAVMVVSVMRVPIMVVYMNENARERSSRRCKGYANGRRDSKCERHHPKEDDAASACSFQSRQHSFR